MTIKINAAICLMLIENHVFVLLEESYQCFSEQTLICLPVIVSDYMEHGY